VLGFIGDITMHARLVDLMASVARPGWTWDPQSHVLRHAELELHVAVETLAERHVTVECELQALLYLYEERAKRGGKR
jgi:hypothetical protein